MSWGLGWTLLAVLGLTLLVRLQRNAGRLLWWYPLFFLSGIPALIYQIVWQRALFTLYGVNIESVTVVVTAFMLGLGLGSLVGGVISKSRQLSLLLVFGLVELLIAAYGLASLQIFRVAAVYTAGTSALQTGLIAFVLVVVPTMLMGCTLPLLTAHSVRSSSDVGTSVSTLYALNTLGSATACFLAGLYLMHRFGESGSVRLSAALNAAIGGTILLWYFRRRAQALPEPAIKKGAVNGDIGNKSRGGQAIEPAEGPPVALMSFPMAIVTVGSSGFIALAYEIAWYRVFSFTTAGMAKSFAYLLGAYLAGVALGSAVAEYLCEKRLSPHIVLRWVAAFILLSNVIGFLVAPLLAVTVRSLPYTHTLPLISVAAALLGATFPLICHVAVAADERAGSRLSFLYFSNIVGAALGSYTVGFVLMDYFHFKEIAVVLALLGICLATAIIPFAGLTRLRFGGFVLGCGAAAIFVLMFAEPLFAGFYERLLLKGGYQPGMRFYQTSETKSGVVNVTVDGMVFGGGLYDGRYNIDLLHDSNGIFRAYFLSCVHPDPEEILVVGFASGSWAEVIANHPGVRRVTIVEINPGYFDLLTKHPEEQVVLENPKVETIIDDGRRWLIRNPDRRFDLIVMNTTYNWRAHASNLLSSEFLQMARHHLKPGGMLYYNTTSSEEVQATGLHVFPYGIRVSNFMLVGDSPIHIDKDRWRKNLEAYKIEGHPVFDLTKDFDRLRLSQVLSLADTLDRVPANPTFSLESADSIRVRTKGVRIITDDNMGTEWSEKAGKL